MKIALIGCHVLSREISYEVAISPHSIRTWWLRQGLHDTPDLLRREVQSAIDQIEAENLCLPEDKRFTRICLGYGLCSNGVIGLKARSLPLCLPRCDDCISLFLGSAERYRTLFRRFPGCYWYNSGWIENAFTPSEASYQTRLEQYIEEYGEDNAEYLLEMENSWIKNYRHCCYIQSPVYQCAEHERYTQEAARHFGWEYHCEKGDNTLLHDLLNGPWDSGRFLICPPGHEIAEEFTGQKFQARPAKEEV